ncbi:MAG: hypothetical protein P8Y70_18615 [Candidatus Lokiarchaeota archaeon]
MENENINFEDLNEKLLEIYDNKKRPNKAIENKIREAILKYGD